MRIGTLVTHVSMQHRSTRRKFIATLGAAGTVAFTGCSALSGNSGSPDTDTSSSPTSPTPQGTKTKTGTRTSSPGTPTNGNGGNGGNSSGGNGGQNNKKNIPFKRGKVVEDFEDISRIPSPDYGKYKPTTKDVYQGSQSLVLEPQKPSKRPKSLNRPYARMNLIFTEPLDLSKNDLTMAVKVEKPDAIDIHTNLFAPSENISVTSVRQIKTDMDDWIRYDLGYTGKNGKPNLKQVLKMQIVITVPPGGPKDFRVKVDDIRTIPKPKKGKVILQFDDGHISSFKNAYPILKKKGWPAACAVIPDAIGAEQRLSIRQMRKMKKDGWDMMSHPKAPPETGLPGLPKNVQRRRIEQAQRKLTALQFKKGARHFVAPYNRLSGTTVDILRDVHETAFLFGGCPNNAQQPSNPHFISRVQGQSLRETKDIVNMAAKFNQLAVVQFHVIGNYKGYSQALSKKAFKKFADFIEKKNVDVITPSQLIDGK